MENIKKNILMICTGSASADFKKNDYIFIKDVVSYGLILSPAQINMLKISGSTMIPAPVYDNIPHKELKTEIERISGCSVNIIKDLKTGSILVKNKKSKRGEWIAKLYGSYVGKWWNYKSSFE